MEWWRRQIIDGEARAQRLKSETRICRFKFVLMSDEISFSLSIKVTDGGVVASPRSDAIDERRFPKEL